MGRKTYRTGPDQVPEGELMESVALVTLRRGSDCSQWMSLDDNDQPTGTYMIVCVIGPKFCADLNAAMQALTAKWDEDEERAE